MKIKDLTPEIFTETKTMSVKIFFRNGGAALYKPTFGTWGIVVENAVLSTSASQQKYMHGLINSRKYSFGEGTIITFDF